MAERKLVVPNHENIARALEVAHTEKPFRDMQVNAHNAGFPYAARELETLAYYAGVEAEIRFDRPSRVRPIAAFNYYTGVEKEDEYIVDAALRVNALITQPPIEEISRLADFRFDNYGQREELLPYDPSTTTQIETVRAMLGASDQIRISSPEDPSQRPSTSVFESATKMGFVLVETLYTYEYRHTYGRYNSPNPVMNLALRRESK